MARTRGTLDERRRAPASEDDVRQPIWLAALGLSALLGFGDLAVSNAPFEKAAWYDLLTGGFFFLCCLFISLVLDRRRADTGRDSWVAVFGLSLAAAVIVEPVCWLIASQPFASLREHPAPFIFVTVVEDVLVFLLWSLLHVAIRAGERETVQERRIAAVREAMLRDENDALLYKLDPEFLTQALAGIGDRVGRGARDAAGESVIVLAEHMRAALSAGRATDEGGRKPDAQTDDVPPRASADETGPTRRRFLIWSNAAWLALLGAVVVTSVPRAEPVRFLILYAPQPLIGALWSLVMAAALGRRSGRALKTAYAEAAGLVLAGCCVTSAAFVASGAALGLLDRPGWLADVPQFSVLYTGPAFMAWAAAWFLFEARRREIARLRAEADIREAAQKARNAALRQQINPHFLFNALNALYALILGDERDRAQAVIGAIGRFVERAGGDADIVPLSAELATQDAYLDIERVRFGDRLQVERRVAAELVQAKVPRLILQPLVENAVKYGVGPTHAPVRVEIAAERSGGELVLSVRDSGAPDARSRPPNVGVGLQNVERRLKSLYGDAGALICRPLSPAGFLAEVRIPLVL